MDQDQPKKVRRYASTIGILVILAAVLAFYYLKYVPERRSEFNQAAFLELTQIENALQFQNTAYHDALQNIFHKHPIDSNALVRFNLQGTKNSNINKIESIDEGRFNFLEEKGNWNLVYPAFAPDKKTRIYTLSKNADTLMSSLVSTYKDIFDGYLLIDNEECINGEHDKGQIIFQSGDQYLNSAVNPDSLLKKKESLNLNSLQDVTIGGNDYKLFLFPFEMGSQNLILVGLISDANYREANLKIPFSFFSVFIVILLLLIIHLPILRIYILGANERIRERDIRLIIGSYFVAAFFGFFIFTKIFLNREQAVQTKNNIQTISDKIIGNFQKELGLISQQLTYFNNVLDRLSVTKDFIHLKSMSAPPEDSSSIRFLDSTFKPRIYPSPINVFWLNDKGHWVARWAFKKALTKSPLIDVSDRRYFKDFVSHEPLSIDGLEDPITIQPTLSKLEGDYVVTVAKKIKITSYSVRIPQSTNKGKMLEVNPSLIGMATEMHAVNNVAMPSGYNFSIIDESGNILYDSKPGRPLLSNIFREMENQGPIQQSAIYRNTRYFDDLRLRSKNMALLSRPINGMPYQLLVYYNKARSDEFEEHLITLSSGLIGAVIFLVIFSSLINRWSKEKYRMLESSSHHFEWLYPSNDFYKQKYYRHLISGMLFLMGIYLLSWVFLENLPQRSEFSFLFITLLFPFYISVFYYELRERYYDVQEKRTEVKWYYARPSIVLRGSLLVIIVLINCCLAFVKFSWSHAWPVLITQLIWAFFIMLATIRFRYFMMTERNRFDLDSNANEEENEDDHPNDKIIISPVRPVLIRFFNLVRTAIFAMATHEYRLKKIKYNIRVPAPGVEKPDPHKGKGPIYKISTNFIWAILIGVTLVSIVPAFSLFWLFYRQETALYLRTDQLIMAKEIDRRAGAINHRAVDFKYNLDSSFDRSSISQLKFSYGIYTIYDSIMTMGAGPTFDSLNYPTSEYVQFHDQIFPGDSVVLNWIQSNDTAADGSWYFINHTTDMCSGPELVYLKRKDGINPESFRLISKRNADCNTSSLILHSFSGMGTAFCIFFIVGLCFSLAIAYFLTLSLAKRIFLVELQQVMERAGNTSTAAEEIYKKSRIEPAVRAMILNTGAELKIRATDNFKTLRHVYHFEKKLPLYKLEAMLPSLIDTLEPVYCNLWTKLSARYKFILFDFAQDGFANYKAGKDLQALIEKGLLFFEDQRLCVMTLSFQEYILQQSGDPELNTFLSQAKKENTWNRIQTPLLVLLMVAGIFIFATQEEVYKKITGLLATVTSLLPMLNGMFGKAPAKGGE